MLPELTTDEFSLALDAVAAGALSELPSIDPPIDALQLAAALGLAVAWDERQPGRARVAQLATGGAVATQPSILLKRDPRRERVHWAVAHEIGEWCAFQVFERLSVDPREAPSAARESVANHLASRLLLPRELFGQCGRDAAWELPALKQVFATASHELIARRMLDFEIGVIITVFDHGRRTFRRANLPFRLPPLLEAELAAWRAAHEQNVPAVEIDERLRVQAWPVHEPEWKREILRAEWLEE